MPIAKRKKNGRQQWVADYRDGSGHRVQRFFRTREEAEETFAKAVIVAQQKTRPDLPTSITFAQYAERWLAQGRTHLKPASCEAYDRMLRLHLVPAFGGLRLRDLQRGRIKAVLTEKRERYARNTLHLMLGTLCALLNAAIEDELIVANPAAKLGRALRLVQNAKVRQEQVKAMTREQRDVFLRTATTVEPWWAPMWAVQARTGLRPGEVYALREDDDEGTRLLDLEAGTARILATLNRAGTGVGTPKGNRARTVDLSAQTVAILRAHLGRRKAEKLARGWKEMPAPIFCSQDGGYADADVVRHAMDRVLKAASLPHFSPHSLRHTYASALLDAGKDVYYVCRMLGHASIKETVDTYGRWLPANRRGELDVLDDPPALQPPCNQGGVSA